MNAETDDEWDALIKNEINITSSLLFCRPSNAIYSKAPFPVVGLRVQTQL
jgi:hypothetical protein